MRQYQHHQIQYAGFLRRALAFIIDMTLVSLISTALILTIFGGDQLQQMQSLTSWHAIDWRIVGIEQILPAVWTISFWFVWMATPGKLLLDCQVVDARTLQKAGFGQLVVRYLGYILSSLPLGLGFIWIIFNPRRQGWHDKLSGTVVIMQDDSLLPLESLA